MLEEGDRDVSSLAQDLLHHDPHLMIAEVVSLDVVDTHDCESMERIHLCCRHQDDVALVPGQLHRLNLDDMVGQMPDRILAGWRADDSVRRAEYQSRKKLLTELVHRNLNAVVTCMTNRKAIYVDYVLVRCEHNHELEYEVKLIIIPNTSAQWRHNWTLSKRCFIVNQILTDLQPSIALKLSSPFTYHRITHLQAKLLCQICIL